MNSIFVNRRKVEKMAAEASTLLLNEAKLVNAA
jgi:hypothetical protein